MINIRKNAVNFWWLCNISQYLSVRNIFSLAQEKNAYALREKQSTSIYITRSIETIRSAIFVMSGPLRSISNAKIIVITFVTSANAMANARYTSFWACKTIFMAWLLFIVNWCGFCYYCCCYYTSTTTIRTAVLLWKPKQHRTSLLIFRIDLSLLQAKWSVWM